MIDVDTAQYVLGIGSGTTLAMVVIKLALSAMLDHIVLFTFLCIAVIGLCIKYACELMLAGYKLASELDIDDMRDIAEYGDMDESLAAQFGMYLNRKNYRDDLESLSLEEYKKEYYDKENDIERVLEGVRGTLHALDRAETLEIEAFKDDFYDEDKAETKRRAIARAHLMKSLGFSEAETKLATDYHEVIEL
jgi:hypothetical protein